MLQTRWSCGGLAQVRVDFKKALALKSQIRRAGWFNEARDRALLVRRRAGARRALRLDSAAAVPNRGAHAADRARGHSRLSLALARLAAETQQAAPSQPRQVGWLGVVAGPPLQDEFRRGMRELGHVEGAGPIARWGRGKIERPKLC